MIVDAVEALPADLDGDLGEQLAPGIVDRAEAQLVADAATFDPRDLRVLGERILEVVAPEIAEVAEARKLEAAERRARERVRLTMRRQGDGTTRISGLIPDLCASQLSVMLGALLNPRRTPAWAEDHASGDDPGEGVGPWWALPAPCKLGQALCELLGRINPSDLPVHGTTAATLFVTVGLDQLRSGVGAATILGDGGETRVSASEARRLACVSGIIPTVLGSRSEVLDLGRTARLFSPAQARALLHQHPICQAVGCRHPASHCGIHHHDPWSEGGATDLADGVVLCVHHHHLVHDPTFATTRHADGTVTFARI